MINRFREWILKIVNAYPEDYVEGRLTKKKIPKKNLTKLKEETVVVDPVKPSTKKLVSREVPDDYEIENVLLKLNDEIPEAKKYKRNTKITEQERLLYHFRFINYTDEDYDQLLNSLKNDLAVPETFERFSIYLHYKNNRMYFKDLPILSKNEIQTLCRNTYFDPTLPFGCDQIYREISDQGANLSRSKVRKAVQSIEQYQLRRAIRRPGKIEANFITTSSNTILVDMFFINKWKFFNCCEAFSG